MKFNSTNILINIFSNVRKKPDQNARLKLKFLIGFNKLLKFLNTLEFFFTSNIILNNNSIPTNNERVSKKL